ncbi:hypothetical protein QLX67_00555 [Balneolaceae bacterium ANBcel3]|nr:hypothetical protein [Balneolaceae bacterium ANBcel3]
MQLLTNIYISLLLFDFFKPPNRFVVEMRKTAIPFLFLFIFTLGTVESYASDQNKGVGVLIGDPTGISFALRTQTDRAFAGGLAWSFRGHSTMHFHLDYLFYHHGIIPVEKGSLPLYYGLGGRLRFGDTDKLGIRIPLGIAYQFENDPIELFFEIVPILELVPGTALSGNAAIGIRYYF